MLVRLQQSGIDHEHFNGDYQQVWSFIARMASDHGEVPSPDILESRFDFLDISKVKKRDAAALAAEVRQRRRYQRFLGAVSDASYLDDPDGLELALADLQQSLNALSVAGNRNSLVDAFGKDARERMAKDLKDRRRGGTVGIPTGLQRLDYVTNGLQAGRMWVIMGRPGLGKSWLNLLFCASAVMNGYKVVLFPLEMTFEETVLRLYTIMSQRMYGSNKVFRNLDLANGRITPKKVVKFLHVLEDKFAGQLLVADIGASTDPYTIDRVRAEVAIHRPDMFWVDYITLLKNPGRSDMRDDLVVKMLSNGIKQTAMMYDCVGGASAQVNREAIKARAFLPRVENIAYGDSIGQDADGVLSINRKDAYLYYACVKHRGGPEVGKTRAQFMVDEGIIGDTKEQDEDDDDD